MTNKIKTALLAVAIGAGFTACSDIDSDDRFIDMGTALSQRTVLLEDFTGQDCTNCPAAHRVMEELAKQYGDKLITVSIHGGGFGVKREYTCYDDNDPSENYICLMTPEGTSMNDEWGINSWPKGVVNHRGQAVESDKWAALIRQESERPANAEIELSASYDAASNLISIATTVEPKADFSAKLRLWVIEDGIVAYQVDGANTIDDYVHNHVYRATVTGNGLDTNTSFKKGEYRDFSNSIASRYNDEERWVPENLSIVAILLDDDGVVQVAKAHVE